MNIKKLIACAIASAAMLMQLTAFAAIPDGATNYTSGYNNNDLTVNASTAQTVLIYRVQDDIGTAVEFTDEEIVYVNQSNSAFGASAAFLLKENPEAGLYKVILGGGDTSTTGYLEIDMALDMITGAEADGYIATYVDSDGKTVYKKGFLAEVTADECNEYNLIKLVNGSKVLTFSIADEQPTVTSGEGGVLVGIQLYNIPDAATANALELYLSKGEATTTTEVDAE